MIDIIKNINSVSYIGKPISHTAMYITKKVESLLSNLLSVENCLVFCEDTIQVWDDLLNKHKFVMTKNPQYDYAKYVNQIALEKDQKNAKRRYKLTENGYYVGENVKIGCNAIIEPLCFIDHDVIIGDNAIIRSGTKIRNAIIGDNFIVNENAIIGSYGFTMSRDENNNIVRIPTIGKVVIGNNVEIGMLSNISVGSAGNTTINNYVKIDSFVHIAHDVTLDENVEIPSGAIIGGFCTIEQNAFIGINATVRNRVTIGEHSVIGMGSVVTKSVPANTTVIGNPARPFIK